MNKRQRRKTPEPRVWAGQPPFPRRAGVRMAIGLAALAPAAVLGAFPANLELSTLTGTDGFKLSGVAAFDFSGISVSAAGDVNGDGVDDVIIGADRADPNGSDSGASYVVFGKDTATAGAFPANLALSTLDGTNGSKLSGVAAGDNSGVSVSEAGDINGDGMDDVIIGALLADPNGISDSGASYVVFIGRIFKLIEK